MRTNEFKTGSGIQLFSCSMHCMDNLHFLVNWRDNLTVNRSRLQELAQHCNLGKALVQFMVLDSQTPETPNIPNFENIGSPGVQTPETPKTLKMLRQLGVSGVWTPGLPIPLKYGILGVSGVWESGLPKPSILVVLGVQESNQLTIA